MDPLTHSLVGATIARTRLGRATPRAAAALVIGANLPDVDVIGFVGGNDAAFAFRRGWTHGPPALVLLPIVATLVLLAFDRRRARRDPGAPRARPWMLLGLTYLGCITHPALDWLNTYGVRWLMPFDDRWFYGDAMFIIDPWMWLVLGGAVFLSRADRNATRGWLLLAGAASVVVLAASAVTSLVVQLIWFAALGLVVMLDRRKVAIGRAAGIASVSLILAAAYTVSLIVASSSASSWARQELARQGVTDVQRLMVGPVPANPLRWEFVAETPDAYRFGFLGRPPGRSLELDPRAIDRPVASPVVDAALNAPQVRGTVAWMRFPYVEVDDTPDGFTVYILDARYVRARTTGFGGVVVRLDPQLRPID